MGIISVKLLRSYTPMIENPFESGHIKNYLLLYASVVVIVILFFIAANLFYDVKEYDKKVFSTEQNASFLAQQQKQKAELLKKEAEEKTANKEQFQLLPKGY